MAGRLQACPGLVRAWLFAPLARFADFDALNNGLATRCTELARRKLPVTPERWVAAMLGGYGKQMLRVSCTAGACRIAGGVYRPRGLGT